jgi:hypothetical protein
MVSTPACCRTWRVIWRDAATGTMGSAASGRVSVSDTDADQTRRSIHELLVLIGDRDAQRAYERDVPIANVPAELICMWFEDHYHPAAGWFVSAFSADELAELAAFNDFYRARTDNLPTSGGIDVLQKAREWGEIVNRARATLVRLGWSAAD